MDDELYADEVVSQELIDNPLEQHIEHESVEEQQKEFKRKQIYTNEQVNGNVIVHKHLENKEFVSRACVYSFCKRFTLHG